MKGQQPASSNSSYIRSQGTLDLIDKLSPFLSFEKFPANRRFYLFSEGINMCYFIRSGLIRVRRDADEIVITSLPVPNVFGISSRAPTASALFIETLDESEIALLTTEEALQLVAENNVWEALAGHVTGVTATLFHHNVIMTAPTAYEVLRFQLIELSQEPERIRLSTSAAKYIQERTRLSRSTVMKILAQLKQGGYIELDDGVLKVINHLPKKY